MKKNLARALFPFSILFFGLAMFFSGAIPVQAANSCTPPQVTCDSNFHFDAVNGSCMTPYCTSDAQCVSLFGTGSQCLTYQQGCANTCTLGSGGAGVITPTASNATTATLNVGGTLSVGGTFQVTVTGPASTAFNFCATQAGQSQSCTQYSTNSTGGWSQIGTFVTASVGSWQESVTFQDAGQETASTNFTVQPAATVTTGNSTTNPSGSTFNSTGFDPAQMTTTDYPNLSTFFAQSPVFAGVYWIGNTADGFNNGGISYEWATEATADWFASQYGGTAVQEPAPLPACDPTGCWSDGNPPQWFVQLPDGTLLNAGQLAWNYWDGDSTAQNNLMENATKIANSYTTSPNGSAIVKRTLDPQSDYSEWVLTDAKGYTWQVFPYPPAAGGQLEPWGGFTIDTLVGVTDPNWSSMTNSENSAGTNSGVTSSATESISSASYNSATGIITVTGTGFGSITSGNIVLLTTPSSPTQFSITPSTVSASQITALEGTGLSVGTYSVQVWNVDSSVKTNSVTFTIGAAGTKGNSATQTVTVGGTTVTVSANAGVIGSGNPGTSAGTTGSVGSLSATLSSLSSLFANPTSSSPTTPSAGTSESSVTSSGTVATGTTISGNSDDTAVQAELAALEAEVATLSSQLAALEQGKSSTPLTSLPTTTSTSTAPVIGAFCHTFTDVEQSPSEIDALQTALMLNGENVTVTGVIDAQTTAGVVAFQEKYASAILAPLGLTAGTGNVGPATRAELNKFYACGTGTLTGELDNNVAPVITSLSPTSGPAGTQVTITATGLSGSASIISFGQTYGIHDTALGNNTLSFTVPASSTPGTYAVSVADAANGTSNTMTFTVTNGENSGSPIMVTTPAGGENLSQGSQYTVQWTSSASASNLPTVNLNLLQNSTYLFQIASSVPNTGSYTWTVPSNYSGSGFALYISAEGILPATSNAFSISPVSVVSTSTPVISSIFPTSGSVGSQVTIMGDGFTGGNLLVNFGLGRVINPYKMTVTGGDMITFAVPSSVEPLCAYYTGEAGPCTTPSTPVSSGLYQVWVSNANGTSNVKTFTVTQTTNPYDVNGDGVVNALDFYLVDNASKHSADSVDCVTTCAVTGDGTVSQADVIAEAKYIQTNVTPNPFDVNGDGVVNSTDLTDILFSSVGLSTTTCTTQCDLTGTGNGKANVNDVVLEEDYMKALGIPTGAYSSQYDVNGDGVVNALDFSDVYDAWEAGTSSTCGTVCDVTGKGNGITTYADVVAEAKYIAANVSPNPFDMNGDGTLSPADEAEILFVSTGAPGYSTCPLQEGCDPSGTAKSNLGDLNDVILEKEYLQAMGIPLPTDAGGTASLPMILNVNDANLMSGEAATGTVARGSSLNIIGSFPQTGSQYMNAFNAVIDGVDATTTMSSASEITVPIPTTMALGIHYAMVSGSVGSSNLVQFTVIASPAGSSNVPTITGITPSTGPAGTQVTITGSNFAPTGNGISFDVYTFLNVPSSNNGTTLTFTVPGQVWPNACPVTGCPSMAGKLIVPGSTYNVSVTNSGGTSNVTTFNVTSTGIFSNIHPSITNISTQNPQQNGTLSLFGGFNAGSDFILVDLAPLPPAAVTLDTASEITVSLAGLAPGGHAVQVVNNFGVSNVKLIDIQTSTITVNESQSGTPTITSVYGYSDAVATLWGTVSSSLTPNVILGAGNLVLTGSFGPSGNTIMIDGSPVTPIFQSVSVITVPVTNLSGGEHTISVVTPLGTTNTAQFTFITD